MNTRHIQTIFTGLLVVTLLAVHGSIASAKTTTGKFIENFDSNKYLDVKLTTADWSADEGSVTLPYTVTVQRSGTADGVPNFRFSSLNGDDQTRLLGGNVLVLPVQTVNGQLWREQSSSYADLTSLLNGLHGTVTAIGYNGSYWLIGGPGLFLKYDGTTTTDLSSQYSASFSGYPSGFSWSGSEWLFTGGANGLGMFDGTTLTNLWSAATFPSYYQDAAWNAREKKWLIVFQGGTKAQNLDISTLYTYDGSLMMLLKTPDDIGNSYHVASDGKQWLISGWSSLTQKPTLYLYDGKKFTNLATKIASITDTALSNIFWEGKYWLLRTTKTSGADAIFYSMDRHGAIQKNYPIAVR